ncbi:MAG: RNA-binding protein [Bdellovibrionales bacterium]|nr:RNA-binding protein [Bdellovibrionales bacterium]
MGKKLYVGNLSYSVDSNQLNDLFAQAGSVESANVIMDRDSGRSKGFAFVEMSDAAEAQDAIGKYNGFSLDGRAMNVSEAKPQENRKSRSGGSFRPRTAY